MPFFKFDLFFWGGGACHKAKKVRNRVIFLKKKSTKIFINSKIFHKNHLFLKNIFKETVDFVK